MKFIGRQAELNKLNAEYTRDGSFVVIYGRRRVGKTTLIKEFLKKKTAFYFLATEELESQSMKRLAGVIARTTKNALLQKATFTDWLDLFQVIADYKPEEKKVLVIDEFPYLVKTNSAFPSILQNAWDEILKDSNVMLILSGSLIGMMKKYALSYDSPLYGRRTAQIRLAPLSFTDIYAVQKMPFAQAAGFGSVWCSRCCSVLRILGEFSWNHISSFHKRKLERFHDKYINHSVFLNRMYERFNYHT